MIAVVCQEPLEGLKTTYMLNFLRFVDRASQYIYLSI